VLQKIPRIIRGFKLDVTLASFRRHWQRLRLINIHIFHELRECHFASTRSARQGQRMRYHVSLSTIIRSVCSDTKSWLNQTAKTTIKQKNLIRIDKTVTLPFSFTTLNIET
jgi:hypothetical protein